MKVNGESASNHTPTLVMRNLHTPAHADRTHRDDRRGAVLRLGALAVVYKGRGAASALVSHRGPVVVAMRVLWRHLVARRRASAAVVVVVAGLGLALGAAAAAGLAGPARAAEYTEE